jgi:TonB family protein
MRKIVNRSSLIDSVHRDQTRALRATAGLIVRAVLLLFSATVSAQTLKAAESPAPAEEPVEVEVFRGPKVLKFPPLPFFPTKERLAGEEGWVQVNFMIDTQGKPYEISVTDSTGNAAFEKIATEFFQQVVYQPAMLGKNPVHSGYVSKLRFEAGTMEASGSTNRLRTKQRASTKFAAAYRAASEAIEAGDRPKADELIANLTVKNLYEDAYKNIARYNYYKKWGTEKQQLAALQGAVAGEDRADYLSKELFHAALHAMLTLQLKHNDFGRAMWTWERLKWVAPAKEVKQWEGTIEQVMAARRDTRPLPLAGEIEKGTSWFGKLFRNRFELTLASGNVSEIKLRCQKQYLFFRYEPNVLYTVKKSDDACDIEVIGEPGAKFVIVQT